MQILKKPSTLVVLALILAAIVLAALYIATSGSTASAADDTQIARIDADASWAFDVGDKRKVVGFSEDVFEGRVVEQVGNEGIPTSDPDYTSPRTQFSVQVLESIKGKNIKGKLPRTVVVEQEAGYVDVPREEGQGSQKALVAFEDDELLEPGRTYLFSVKYSAGKARYVVSVPGYGNVPTDEEGEAKRKEVKDKFKKAKNEEIDPIEEQRPILESSEKMKSGEKVQGKTFEEKAKE